MLNMPRMGRTQCQDLEWSIQTEFGHMNTYTLLFLLIEQVELLIKELQGSHCISQTQNYYVFTI